MAKKQKKKVEPKKEVKKESFYVGLKDPIEMRRTILESSKEVVQYLQRFERFKKVRSDKAEEIAKLKVITADASKLIRKLKSELPKTSLRAPLHNHELKEKKSQVIAQIKEAQENQPLDLKQQEPKKKAKEKEMTELQKLEAELSEIESRLVNLS